MSRPLISLVPADHIDTVWPDVEPFVVKALKYTSGKYKSDDVWELIAVYGYPLWIAFSGTSVKGMVVTRFVQYPRKKYLFLEFCGGVDGFSWKAPMLATLRSWAKDNGCDGIEGAGRLGWQKVFESDGYKRTLFHFELPLN